MPCGDVNQHRQHSFDLTPDIHRTRSSIVVGRRSRRSSYHEDGDLAADHRPTSTFSTINHVWFAVPTDARLNVLHRRGDRRSSSRNTTGFLPQNGRNHFFLDPKFRNVPDFMFPCQARTVEHLRPSSFGTICTVARILNLSDSGVSLSGMEKFHRPPSCFRLERLEMRRGFPPIALDFSRKRCSLINVFHHERLQPNCNSLVFSVNRIHLVSYLPVKFACGLL